MNLYSGSGALTYSNIYTWENNFAIQGYPTAYVNHYAEVGNMTDYTVTRDVFISLAQEAVSTSELASNTAIGGVASIVADSVVVTVNVASKAAGAYYLNAFLLEDGVFGQQSDYLGVVEDQNNYEHSNIVRASLTADFGDVYALSAEGNQEITLSIPMPANVVNPDNLHVVVYTTKVGTFRGSVYGAAYGNYGYVVDNVVNMPMGEFVEFAYGN